MVEAARARTPRRGAGTGEEIRAGIVVMAPVSGRGGTGPILPPGVFPSGWPDTAVIAHVRAAGLAPSADLD
ncbi:hypothetical protein GCM10009793_09060 [Brachybacterium phenoliresistens]